MLDNHQLQIFLVASETLNFTQAAQRLHLSQPSVSQQIQALEAHLGAKLFIRAGRRIELTGAGMELVPHAREVVSRAIHIEELMESLKGDLCGRLEVACSTSPSKYILPQMLAQFHQRYPRVRVSCTSMSEESAIQMLQDANGYLALASAPNAYMKGVETQHFMTDELLLVVPLTHPWAKLESIDIDDLTTTPIIMRERESGTFQTLANGLAQQGLPDNHLETRMVLGTTEGIALAVQEGLGVGFVSRLVVERLVAGRVHCVKVRGLELKRDIHLCRSARYPSSRAQQAFWQFANDRVSPALSNHSVVSAG